MIGYEHATDSTRLQIRHSDGYILAEVTTASDGAICVDWVVRPDEDVLPFMVAAIERLVRAHYAYRFMPVLYASVS